MKTTDQILAEINRRIEMGERMANNAAGFNCAEYIPAFETGVHVLKKMREFIVSPTEESQDAAR